MEDAFTTSGLHSSTAGINRCTIKSGSNYQRQEEFIQYHWKKAFSLKVRTDRSTAGIIYKNKHQNSIYTIRSRGAFKIRGLSLKHQIIAKDTRTPNNQIPLRRRCWMPTSAFSELVREHRMETSLLVSYWYSHDSTTRAWWVRGSSWGWRMLVGDLGSQTFYYSSLTSFQGRVSFLLLRQGLTM